MPGRFIPRCTTDGRYEGIQCEEATCYCVNEDGHEIHGTRTTLPERPDCSNIGRYNKLCTLVLIKSVLPY